MWIEVKNPTERQILLILKDGEINQSMLAEKIGMSNRWISKKLNDLSHRHLVKERERGKYNERFVSLVKENVRFKYLSDEFIKPLIPSMIGILFCFILFIKNRLLSLLLIGSLISFVPHLVWSAFNFLTKKDYIMVFEYYSEQP
ncbi:MAG: hypothetical protein ACTSW1_00670 [Candidatus Hodarchaeales archaeon]